MIELFDWQEVAEDMISELEFVRMVSVQSETVRRYIMDGKIEADLEVPMGRRKFYYFKKDKVKDYAKEFNWDLITPANIKDKFMEYIDRMDMSYSYKPVFMKGFIEHMDGTGKVKIEDLVDYFIDYYEARRSNGLVVEKKRCMYIREPDKKGRRYTRSEVKRNILSNPFKRFEDMNFIRHHKNIGYLVINRHILKNLSEKDIDFILEKSDEKLEEYYKNLP